MSERLTPLEYFQAIAEYVLIDEGFYTENYKPIPVFSGVQDLDKHDYPAIVYASSGSETIRTFRAIKKVSQTIRVAIQIDEKRISGLGQSKKH